MVSFEAFTFALPRKPPKATIPTAAKTPSIATTASNSTK